jgi:hypothetical protein
VLSIDDFRDFANAPWGMAGTAIDVEGRIFFSP